MRRTFFLPRLVHNVIVRANYLVSLWSGKRLGKSENPSKKHTGFGAFIFQVRREKNSSASNDQHTGQQFGMMSLCCHLVSQVKQMQSAPLAEVLPQKGFPGTLPNTSIKWYIVCPATQHMSGWQCWQSQYVACRILGRGRQHSGKHSRQQKGKQLN